MHIVRCEWLGVPGYGERPVLVKDPNDLGAAFRTALEAQQDRPALIDIRTTTDPAKMLPGVDARTSAKVSN